MNTNKILIIGVTGSGKSRLAFELAKAIDAEIISVDSMKVYRRMDIGTAKPPYKARKRINYHLIDVAAYNPLLLLREPPLINKGDKITFPYNSWDHDYIFSRMLNTALFQATGPLPLILRRSG